MTPGSPAPTQCSATCGEGTQQRQVVCRNVSSALGPCEGVKPDTVQVCSLPACGGDLQNSTVKAEVQDTVTKVGHWELQSRPLTPTDRISTMEPCVGDRSIFCRMEVLDRYCTIPGYNRLCCESCIKKASGPDASLTSLPTFSTPGSLLPEPKATQEDMESTRGPTSLEDSRQSQPTPLLEVVDGISSVTQHPVTPYLLNPKAFEGSSPTTPQSPPWYQTQTAVPTSESQGQSREEPGHGGTSLPATSPVT